MFLLRMSPFKRNASRIISNFNNMNIEKVDIRTLLSWYESLICCNHYCPVKCHHRDGIADGVDEYVIYNEIIRRVND